MHEKKIKDKSIGLIDLRYLATVEYYQDTPVRSNDKPTEKIFTTMEAAQIFLSQFPRDVWDGFSITDKRYKEPDERGRNARKSV